jgi:hypothetical protein
MNTANPSALLRTLIVYAICVPLAITVGYMLTNPLDFQSMGFIGIFAGILIFPLLMRWHYLLLIVSWNLPVTLFFLPGHPNLFLAMVAASLTISIIERILDRNQRFLPSCGVAWPLLLFLGVIFLTAKLHGGFGLRSMGSENYGGKKYVFLIVGILSFFAITARPIERKQARRYVMLFFAGGILNFLSDFYPFMPSALHPLYLLIPPSTVGMDQFGNQDIEFGKTRLGGVASSAGTVFTLMLALYGFRGSFFSTKIWRAPVMTLAIVLVFLGGFRASILGVIIMLSLIFYMEKMHRTGVVLAVLMIGLVGATLVVPFSSHLPYTFQRALAFLPLDISPEAKLDAEASTQWRLDIWNALMPQIPKHLLLGKGYGFSAEEFNESMGGNATFANSFNAADNPLAVAGDYHSGPISVVLSFGIWGVIVWLWYWVAGFLVVWRNHRYGDPQLATINRFLVATFIGKVFGFLFIFGDVVNDVGSFAGVIGLSIALNHGVARQPARAKAGASGTVATGNVPLLRPSPALPSMGR